MWLKYRQSEEARVLKLDAVRVIEKSTPFANTTSSNTRYNYEVSWCEKGPLKVRFEDLHLTLLASF